MEQNTKLLTGVCAYVYVRGRDLEAEYLEKGDVTWHERLRS